MSRIRNICTPLAITIVLSISFVSRVSASYVLPYPSYMPGNKLYGVSRIADRMKSYWYWGDIGKVQYHMNLADKYLVEAKTLLEYKQYLLGIDALARSNSEFLHISGNLQSAKQNGKDVSMLSTAVVAESEVHHDTLAGLRMDVPEIFVWEPEKSEASMLKLHELLNQAITIRQQEASSAMHL